VRLLRHSEASWKDVPVLGLTANVLPQDLESFRATGVNAILLKPFDIQQVCTQVSHMLTAKKSFLGS
jgi:CheY-like chemotaxis protein